MEQNKIVMNINEAAAFSGLTPYTLRKLAREGKIKIVVAGNRWMFNRASLLLFLGEDGDKPSRAG